MPTYLVVRRRSGPDWDASVSIKEQRGWDAHASFMDELAERGFIVLGGPLTGDDRVVFAVEAESEEAVRTTLAQDPWHETHLRLAEVVPWSLWLDGREAS